MFERCTELSERCLAYAADLRISEAARLTFFSLAERFRNILATIWPLFAQSLDQPIRLPLGELVDVNRQLALLTERLGDSTQMVQDITNTLATVGEVVAVIDRVMNQASSLVAEPLTPQPFDALPPFDGCAWGASSECWAGCFPQLSRNYQLCRGARILRHRPELCVCFSNGNGIWT